MSGEEENKDLHQEQPNQEESGQRGPITFGNEEDPTKIHIEKNPGEILTGTWGFIQSILSLRRVPYDVPAVVKEIKAGIEFKGYNVWILMCSIVVASVGLNMNSTAVIVGAMLISPLMGPIRGMGFGVAMNDFPMLVESVKNFGVTVAISLFSAWIYFLVSPIEGITEELWARTAPTFMDVIIAFFGGLAGVIAACRGKNDTVIPGVAIATALMPPLCTAGYGLANSEWGYFLGASYLFLLNSLLIGISTILFVRYVRFPKKTYVTPKIERKVSIYIYVFLIVIVSPSIYQFYKMAKRSIFEENAKTFVTEVVESADQNMAVQAEYVFDFDNSEIQLHISNAHMDSTTIASWNVQKQHYELGYARLVVHQGEDREAEWDRRFEEAIGSTAQDNMFLRDELKNKRGEISELKEEIDKLRKQPGVDPLEIDHIMAGFKTEYPEVKEIIVDRSFKLSGEKVDTNYAIKLWFYPQIEETEKKKLSNRIQKRFLFELNQKTTTKRDSVPMMVR